MAKTKDNKKIVPVQSYRRRVNGRLVTVKRHKRSTPE